MPGTRETLAQIAAPHFTAGLVLVDDVVTVAAPILRYMIGWNADTVRSYVRNRGWKIARVRTKLQELD